MVTHDLESLRTVCDRIAALADGRVIAIGTMDAMLASRHPWMTAYFQGKRGHLLGRGRGVGHPLPQMGT
jgi:phospholipid/cholesterol/gamma-HCH transport system ATP-binding protein